MGKYALNNSTLCKQYFSAECLTWDEKLYFHFLTIQRAPNHRFSQNIKLRNLQREPDPNEVFFMLADLFDVCLDVYVYLVYLKLFIIAAEGRLLICM